METNRRCESLIRSLDCRIAALERSVVQQGVAVAGSLLEELWAQRRSLRLLIRNRRIEAAKHVVDFQAWRDGNSAVSPSVVHPAMEQSSRQ